MATASFTHNFKLQNRYADNFIKGLTGNTKPILESNFQSKVVNDIEYKKVIRAFQIIFKHYAIFKLSFTDYRVMYMEYMAFFILPKQSNLFTIKKYNVILKVCYIYGINIFHMMSI